MFKPIKIIDLELSHPPVDLSNLGEYTLVQALVRLHGAPLGLIQVPVVDGCCTAASLRQTAIEQHSWPIVRHLVKWGLTRLPGQPLQLAELLRLSPPRYQGPFPLVTVAVCTRDRPADLAICLEALGELDYPRLDLLVIDNAPRNHETSQLIQSRYPQVRYVCEPRPGLDWARNRAILEAQGEIVAFTDDDVVVDVGWVKALAQLFAEQPEVMGVTGLVVPYELETEAQQLFEKQGGFGKGFIRRWYRVDRAAQVQPIYYHGAGQFGTGANMAFRRSLFERIGDFHPALDVGTATNGGGDLEMFFRLLYAGYTLVYEPSAIVRHRHRTDYATLRRQLTNNGVGLAAFHVQSVLDHPDQALRFLKLHIWWLLHRHIRRLVQSYTRPHHFPRDLIWAEFWGFLRGLGAYPVARRQAQRIVQEFGPISALAPQATVTQPLLRPTPPPLRQAQEARERTAGRTGGAGLST